MLKKLRLESLTSGFPITSLREIKILASLNHRNIVNLKEVCVGYHKDSIFLVFEHCSFDLITFFEKLRRAKQTLRLEEIKSIMIQLLKGLYHLHSNNILHRDLKLSNILINRDGCVKICDFGLARNYGDTLFTVDRKSYMRLTPKVVTLWYRSPEILLGFDYSFSCDMWALGCIFAELLRYGNPLFPSKNELNQFQMICDLIGYPNNLIWPEFFTLENSRSLMERVNNKYNNIPNQFSEFPSSCIKLLNGLLKWNPAKRLSAAEALMSEFFTEFPHPKEVNLKQYNL